MQRYVHSSKELIPGFRKTLPIFLFFHIIQKAIILYMASLCLRSFATLAWSLARLRLEKADKVLRILKAEALAHLRYAEGFVNK